MDYSAYLNIDKLSEEARKELETFYRFLLFKYSKKEKKKKVVPENRFVEFLSTPIKVRRLNVLNRDERNER